MIRILSLPFGPYSRELVATTLAKATAIMKTLTGVRFRAELTALGSVMLTKSGSHKVLI